MPKVGFKLSSPAITNWPAALPQTQRVALRTACVKEPGTSATHRSCHSDRDFSFFQPKGKTNMKKKHRLENRYHYMQFLLLDTFSLWVLHNQMRPRTNNPSISRPFDWGKTLCPGLCLLTPAQTTLCRRAANTQQVWTHYGGWVDVGTPQIAMRQVPMMRWQHDNYFEDSPEARSRCVRCLVSAPVDVEWYWDSSPVTPN
jgi:hypothetical protein